MAMIKGKLWLLHRLIYIYHFKSIKNTIDHIDRDNTNNKIENLRDVSSSTNQLNRGKQINNTSGYKGVYLDKRRGNWVAEIKINYKKHWLGSYSTAEKANLARLTYLKESENDR